ncbi:elongation of very long chain fatty acids protein 4-like [Mercenaria mercenaria]|uniref:elongation of very long chain fatty acids protein 4-like n=1 Tax=Mercenaria mercenaria TaxID=6596 RepID=UPI00234EF5F9|nr:elongation of very long chain fatty acids protein 4-like [Mercenaria mercenaria]
MATLWERMNGVYEWSVEVSDPRTENWLLLYSPWPVTVIFFLYLFIVWAGPKYMKNKSPVPLKAAIIPYNLGLVVLSVYMFYEFFMSAYLAGYSLKCQPVDYSNSPLALRMANVCWWFFFSKVIELLDTVFFILRKKNEQVTFLHVYHHCTMIINWYLGAKYVAGGQSFFVAMLNSFVHIFMYAYYGLAAIGPHMQKYLWWKRYLTRMQLIQFLAFVVHTGYNLMIDCDFPRGFNIAVFLYAVSLIALFGNFYYRTYTNKKAHRQ